MNLNDDVVYRCRRLGSLHQLHPGRSRSLVRHNDCLHGKGETIRLEMTVNYFLLDHDAISCFGQPLWAVTFAEGTLVSKGFANNPAHHSGALGIRQD
jgi:hypothetical protein